jgi:carbonic anhydrase
MDEILEQLKEGVRRFQTEIYPQQAEIFAQAVSEGQRPHTLFITCADSRIDPVAITSSLPGEVFVTRNIGNIVPAYGEMLGGVSAVIEFAVSSLKVGHVVVCGHTHCGAMQALLHPDSVVDMPTVKSWIRNAQAALATAKYMEADPSNAASREPFIDLLTEQNVLLQMQHLKTHPSAAEAISKGTLTISGWVYRIGSGEICVARDGETKFTPIGPKVRPAPDPRREGY